MDMKKQLGDTIGSPLLKPHGSAPIAQLDKASLINLTISLFGAQVVFSLPSKRTAAGNRIPTWLFKDQPDFLEAFILAVMIGFTTSLVAVYSYQRPRLAKAFRVASTVCLSCGALVLLWAIFVLNSLYPIQPVTDGFATVIH